MIDRVRAQLRESKVDAVALLADGPLEPLGSGMDFDVWAAGDRVVRRPKHDDSTARLPVERAVLDALVDLVPPAFRVPRILHLVSATTDEDRPLAVQERLFGISGESAVPMDTHTLARALGELLSCLHTFPIERARALGVSAMHDEYSPEGRLRVMRDEVGVGEAESMRALGVPPEGPHTVLVHADLEPEHLLFDPNQPHVIGVIDWNDVALADPARDLAPLWAHLGDDAFEELLAHYRGPKDSGLRTRVEFLGRCHVTFARHEAREGKIQTNVDWAEAQWARVFERTAR